MGRSHVQPGINPYVTCTLGGTSASMAKARKQQEGKHNFNTSSRVYTASTNVCKRTVNPVWNEEIRFEVTDDTLLQDEPLVFKVWDSTSNNTPLGGVMSDNSIGESCLYVYIRVCEP